MATRPRFGDTASTAGGDGTQDTTTGANRAYVSMSLAEAGEDDDFDTPGDILHVLMRSSVGGPDVTAVAINGSTTSAADYMLFEGNGEFYELAPVDATCITISDDHVRLKRMKISVSESAANARNGITNGTLAAGSEWYLELLKVCQAPGSAGTGSIVGININDSDVVVRLSNSWIYDCLQGTARGVSLAAGTLHAYHCVTYNNEIGWRRGAGTAVTKNCIDQASADGWNGTFDAASTHNISELAADAPTTGAIQGAVTFVNEAGRDFHLDPGDSVAGGAGTDLSADATYPIGVDMDGLVYASWDGVNIGTHQFEDVGGGGPTPTKGRASLLGVGM